MSAFGFMAPGLVNGIDDLQNRQRQNRIDTLLETDAAHRRGIQDEDMSMRREDMSLRRADTVRQQGIQDEDRAYQKTLRDRQTSEFGRQDATRSASGSLAAKMADAESLPRGQRVKAMHQILSSDPDALALQKNDPQAYTQHMVNWNRMRESDAGAEAVYGVHAAVASGNLAEAARIAKENGLDPSIIQKTQAAAQEIQNKGMAQAVMLARAGRTRDAERQWNSNSPDNPISGVTIDKKTGAISYKDKDGTAQTIDQDSARSILLLGGVKLEKAQPDPLTVPRYNATVQRARELDRNIVGLQQDMAATASKFNAANPKDPQYAVLQKDLSIKGGLLRQYQQQRQGLGSELSGNGQGLPTGSPSTSTAPAGTRGLPVDGAGVPAPGNNVVEAGNIDLMNRPVVKMPDGKIATVLSFSVGTDKGEVLLPQISPDGQVWTRQQAIDNYKQTGQHLGIFKNPKAADAYAVRLHNMQDKVYSKRAKDESANAAPPEFAGIQQQFAADTAPENQVDPQLKPFTNGIPMDVGTWKGETIGSSNVDAGVLDPLTRTVQGKTAYTGKPGSGITYRTSAEAENKAAAILAKVNDKTDPEFMSWYRQQEKRTLPKTAFGLLQAYADYRNAGSNS